MGGDSYPTPKSQKFSPAAGQEKPDFFLKFSRIFSRFFSIFFSIFFWIFPDFFLSIFFPPAAGKFHEFFVFTSVWRCFYHSWKYLTAAQARFLLFLRVQERASTIRKSICPLYMRGPVVFCEGRNAHLLFAKCICSRAVVVWVFTSVGTRVYHPQNVRESRTGVSEL